jgi:hypothetical protein
MLMAARVDASGSAVKVIDVTPLFPVALTGPRGNVGVMPGGQRFLINTPVTIEQPTALPPPTVVMNWPAWRSK